MDPSLLLWFQLVRRRLTHMRDAEQQYQQINTLAGRLMTKQTNTKHVSQSDPSQTFNIAVLLLLNTLTSMSSAVQISAAPTNSMLHLQQ
jgi:hypothetical protein